jgi:TonB family protein
MNSIMAAATKRHTKPKCLVSHKETQKLRKLICAPCAFLWREPLLRQSRLVMAFAIFVLLCGITNAQPRVSVLDFGSTPIAKSTTEMLRNRFRSSGEVLVADADLTRAAAKGIGYSGSLNLSIDEARNLGAALATEFYFIGDAQTLRRSSFKTPVYYESYCSIFLISARSGRLLSWDRPSFENNEATAAEARLSEYLSADAFIRRLIETIQKTVEDERVRRTALPATAEPLIEEAPEDEKVAAAEGIRLPRPYRRLRPEYPESAARAEAEATVDVVADVGADGEVGDVQIVRWAGFGLDETTVATVRQLHFFPAMKNGTPIPMRVLLRYNFRKPPR